MARCQLSDEDECHGHDCITRVGTPCIYDILGQAGAEEFIKDGPRCTSDCTIHNMCNYSTWYKPRPNVCPVKDGPLLAIKETE